MEGIQNIHVYEMLPLKTPAQIKNDIQISDVSEQVVLESRNTIKKMLRNKDQRLLVIVGPCSIHDEKAAYEYAERLAKLHKEVEDKIYLVMRVYFEKPRTTIGWKGLINDPHLNGRSDIEYGLHKAREILSTITNMGLPCATEFLDPIVPQYISDLISWAAIGARTTESQTHRELSSGLSMPVGFKNSTEGNLHIAIDAMKSSRFPHSFLGVDQDGKNCIVKTSGNVWGHLILRGGRGCPNYTAEYIREGIEILQKNNLPPYIMVDCSHANSEKKHQNQRNVWECCVDQRIAGNEYIIGLMLESHLHEGNQPIPTDLSRLGDPSQLKYGVSITDACISWETTEELIRYAYGKLQGIQVVKSA
ncbi:MAG: 3-deoxy-7-phosphoheptulonate synthase [bacterium]|jgi:3-deoxy-7-phosphoheptulonate synthase